MAAATRIYLDHAATSWPKPEPALAAMDRFARECGSAAGRGGYRSAIEAGQVIETLRRELADRIHAERPECVTFHPSGTAALNVAIHGLLRPGDHVVTTAAEHNSVLRPLHQLASRGQVEWTVVPCDATGRVDPQTLLSAVRDQTRLVAVTHASNVTGVVQPLAEIGQALRDHPAAVLCDAAQTFGYLPIDVRQLGVDLLASPGHKGGQGPFGTAFLYVHPRWHDRIEPLTQGGTGSRSESLEMPAEMPSKLEPGIVNAPALAGWLASLREIATRPPEEVTSHLRGLDWRLRQGLAELPAVRVFGIAATPQRPGQPERPRPAGRSVDAGRAADGASPPTAEAATDSLPIVSLSVEGLSPSDLATILDVEFGIEVRAGLHCAALIHAALGSDPEGTLRVSGGHSTTEREVQAFLDAMAEITAGMTV